MLHDKTLFLTLTLNMLNGFRARAYNTTTA